MAKTQKTRLVFNPPGPDAPGFLLRQKRALRFYAEFAKMEADDGAIPDVSVLDDMAEFLADYVEDPEDRDEKIEAINQASEQQFKELLRAVTGVTGSDDDKSDVEEFEDELKK